MMRDRRGGGGGDQLNMKPPESQQGLNPPPLIDRRLKETPQHHHHHHNNNNNHHHPQQHNHHQQHQPHQHPQQSPNAAPGNDQQQVLKCPRCDSVNTKFCYYNNYSLLQPRHFCKNCRRYWTKGGALRNVPVGGGCRKNNKRTNSNSNSNNNRPKGSASSSFSSSSSSVADLPLLSSNSQFVPLNTGNISGPHEGGPLSLPDSLPPTPLFFNFPSPGGDDMSFPLFAPPSPALINQQLIRLTPPHDPAMAGSLMGTTIPAAPPPAATSSHLATLASLNNQLANFGALSLRNGFIGLADFGSAMRPPLLQHYGEGATASGPMLSEVDPFLNGAATAATQPHQLAVCSLPLALVPISSQIQAIAPGSNQEQDAMTNGSFSSAITAANLQGGHWKAVQQIEQKLANKQQQPQHSGAETGEESQIIAMESLNNQASIESQDQGLLEAGCNNYWTSSGPTSWEDLPTGYAATPSTGPLL